MRAPAAGKKVTAVVLTHNRIDGAVRRCIEVMSQTRPVDELIVVDNASDDGTADEITRRFPHAVVRRLPENLGPAGGFAAAFTEAMDRGCDYVWALDDDVMVSTRCLEYELEMAEEMPLTVVYPTRLPPDQKHGVAWRGILVPAEIVRAVGVPRADFFWHLEDTEYFLHRIRDVAGFKRAISPRAIVWHGTHRPRRGFPGWKLYYQTRNSIYYRFHLKHDLRGRLKTLARVGARLAVICFREERGPQKAALMVRGIRDGWAGRLGKTLDPRTEPRSAHYRESASARHEEEAEALRRWGDQYGFLWEREGQPSGSRS